MDTSVPKDIITAIKNFNSFIIIGHREPDGDALSAQIALGSFLERKKKSVILVSPGPFDRPEIANQEKLFLKHIPASLSKNTTLTVIVDCSTIDRIGYLAGEIESMKIVVIDHHSSGKPFGDYKFINSEAPSTTFLIQQIIEAFKDVPTPEEADLLFFGLATDTGFFRHLDFGSGDTLKAAGRLVDAGTSPKEAHFRMYGNRTFESRELLGILLAKAVPFFNGKLVLVKETEVEVSRFGKQSRDSDILYQLLFSVKQVEVILLLRYESENEISVGLRSINNVDVGLVAKMFSGGGHKKAAGFTWAGTFDTIQNKLIDIFRTKFE